MITEILAAVSLLFLAQNAIPNCTSHAAMLDFLALRYQEKIVFEPGASNCDVTAGSILGYIWGAGVNGNTVR